MQAKYTVDVARKNEYGEYRVRCYKNGRRYPEGDGFEDSKTAAQEMAAYINFRLPDDMRAPRVVEFDLSDPKVRPIAK